LIAKKPGMVSDMNDMVVSVCCPATKRPGYSYLVDLRDKFNKKGIAG